MIIRRLLFLKILSNSIIPKFILINVLSKSWKIFVSNFFNNSRTISKLSVKNFDYLAATKEKVNQDSYICKSNLWNKRGFWMFGILDGHGSDGHYVSGFAK